MTFTELIGGILLIVGLLSRLATFELTIDLVVAILLVKICIGLIASQGSEAGAELDLALIGAFWLSSWRAPGGYRLTTCWVSKGMLWKAVRAEETG